MPNGVRFRVKNRRWSATTANKGDKQTAKIFNDICQHNFEANGGGIDHPDLAYARVIVNRFNAKITKYPPPEPFDPNVVY